MYTIQTHVHVKAVCTGISRVHDIYVHPQQPFVSIGPLRLPLPLPHISTASLVTHVTTTKSSQPAHQQCENNGSKVHQKGKEAYHHEGEDASYPPALPAGIHIDNGIWKTQVPVLWPSRLLKDEEPGTCITMLVLQKYIVHLHVTLQVRRHSLMY